MQHHTIHFLPDNRTVSIHSGATLIEAAGQAGITLASPCGGVGRCGKCKVELLPSGKSALACQYIVEHDLQVRVPDQSRLLRQQILLHGIGRDMPLDPAVQKGDATGCYYGAAADIGTTTVVVNLVDWRPDRSSPPPAEPSRSRGMEPMSSAGFNLPPRRNMPPHSSGAFWIALRRSSNRRHKRPASLPLTFMKSSRRATPR